PSISDGRLSYQFSSDGYIRRSVYAYQKPKKTMLLNELETVQEEAKEAVNKKAKERAQVFFIGEQSTENPEIFYVSDYRLICAIMGYIIYP
ncbi:hypothetical protein, partial [Escherichia coli]|uniref:hypothetical protein n=1 Tax=Escherichia coli TaxID=562 RepID=UPI001FF34854